MFDLTGKTALVTGASRGIGKAIATALHGAGAHVILSATKQESVEAVAKELGDRATAIAANLSDTAAIDSLTEQATAVTGAVDILINNAGLTRDQLAMRMSDEEWQQVMQVNLAAPFALSKNCIRGMMKNRWGRIINISSVVGVVGNAGQANYAATKAGIIGMSKSLAREVASRGITVNCIAPGFIASDMTAELSEEVMQNLQQQIPLGRIGTPEDIAAAVVYLSSDEAAYITGATLHINGGMFMG